MLSSKLEDTKVHSLLRMLESSLDPRFRRDERDDMASRAADRGNGP